VPPGDRRGDGHRDLSVQLQTVTKLPIAGWFDLFALVAAPVLGIALWQRRIRLYRQQQLYAQQQYEIRVAQSRGAGKEAVTGRIQA
jgi:hypothetical protein